MKTNTVNMLRYMDSLIVFTTILIVVVAVYVICKMTNLTIFDIMTKIVNASSKLFGKAVRKSESNYKRNIAIGKASKETRGLYNFLNDLIIDLNLKQKGATPYEFLFLCMIAALVLDLLWCLILFRSMLLIVFMYPMMLVGLISLLYTRANIAHDSRIDAVIEAENIICNAISKGVIVAVKNSIDVLPKQVRGQFVDFLDSVEHQNYHIVDALNDLNLQLGSISNDFIKKLIVFELEETDGQVAMFQDMIEVNSIKTSLRNDMKHKFEAETNNFIVGALMIFAFLSGVLIIYPEVREFYFTNIIGNIIIAIDLLLLVVEFVIMTYLRAQEI